ncbi:MAG: hypothetical protein HY303_17015 [Candidatus Wallbacteria bacterium]|nr:hypothetical protein [Candidatus Wallbacteria bacterium]
MMFGVPQNRQSTEAIGLISMTRISAILLLSMLAAAPALQAQTLKEWTIVGYFVGDDNKSPILEESQVKNIDELSQRGSGDAYDVVVQVDRSNKINDYLRSRYSDPDYSGAKRYFIQPDKWTVEAKLGEVNMGDPAALLDCLKWAAKSHPAKHYLLVINSHGSGTLSWRGPGSTADSQPGRVLLPVSSYVAYDDTDNDCLTIFELGKALEAFAAFNGGKKLDMMALDACLAASIEALFQFRDGVDTLVASESLVPGHGFAYSSIVSAIAANPAIAPDDLAGIITKSFIDRADSGNVLGAYRTAGAEDVRAACDGLVRELRTAAKETGKVSIQGLTAFAEDKYWDLERIADALIAGRSNTGGAANASQVVAAAQKLKSAIRACRVSLWYSGSFAEQKVGGLSIFWPGKDDYARYRNFYKATAFAAAGLWDDYLDWYELGMQ